MRQLTFLTTVAMLAAWAAPAGAQAPDGANVFQTACASCHLQPAADSRAPNREALRQFAPESIITALTTGSMFLQGQALNDAEKRAVAEFVAGRPVGSVPPPSSTVGRCASSPRFNPSSGASWNGWSGDLGNTRYQPADKGKLTAPLVPRLKLKWAFGFAGVTAARAQPTVVGGRVFVSSESGDVYALDAKAGCTYWSYHAQSGIRTAASVGPYKRPNGGASGFAVYVADGAATAYAIDASTGQLIWSRKLDSHAGARATGSPALYNGRLYVPLAGLGEEGQGGRLTYECCTFRGSVSALDANTGEVVWKSYTIPEEPKPRAKNKEGVQTWGPAGGGIWAAPTIDVRRRTIYVSTGNGYADPPQLTTDAVLALDMATGKIKWAAQPTPNDVWMMGCRPENPDNPNCPAKMGPDHDFSASPILVKAPSGRDLIVIQQKSGMAYAFDPDKGGALVWQYKAGQGSGLGGQWGGAVDDKQAYFGVADFLTPTPGGMRAVKLDTGEVVWSKPPAEKLCGTARGCNAAQGGALTAIPGIVFSGSMDGGLRAYATDDGTVVWQFDTNQSFQTVNGVTAKGGAMDGSGPVVLDGMLFMNSGYGGIVGRPGNVLLAFGVD